MLSNSCLEKLVVAVWKSDCLKFVRAVAPFKSSVCSTLSSLLVVCCDDADVYSGDSDGQHWSIPQNAALHERPRAGFRLVPRRLRVRILIRVRLGDVHTARRFRAHVPDRVAQTQERQGTEWTRGRWKRTSPPGTLIWYFAFTSPRKWRYPSPIW